MHRNLITHRWSEQGRWEYCTSTRIRVDNLKGVCEQMAVQNLNGGHFIPELSKSGRGVFVHDVLLVTYSLSDQRDIVCYMHM